MIPPEVDAANLAGITEGIDVSLPERFATNTHDAIFAQIRREDPVHYCKSSKYGPYWSITSYDDILAVERDYETFSSAGNVMIGNIPPEFDRTWAFATADPPVHTCERKAVNPAVSPQRMAQLQDAVRRDTAALLDSLPRNEDFDWVQRVSVEVTAQTVARLFGFSFEDRHQLPHWCEVLVTASGENKTPEDEAALTGYHDTVLKLWHERKKAPGGDILSALASHPDTADMHEDAWHLIGTVTLIAGANEAARGALSGGVLALHQNQDQWKQLVANPSLIPNMASEIVRWQSPILHMRRTATCDVVFRGRNIRKGDRVVIWFCSGNRDELHFENAANFQIDRHNARRHLGYGFGIHRCLGSHVADMSLRILWEEATKRFKRIEVVAEPRRLLSNFSANYEEMIVRIPS